MAPRRLLLRRPPCSSIPSNRVNHVDTRTQGRALREVRWLTDSMSRWTRVESRVPASSGRSVLLLSGSRVRGPEIRRSRSLDQCGASGQPNHTRLLGQPPSTSVTALKSMWRDLVSTHGFRPNVWGMGAKLHIKMGFRIPTCVPAVASEPLVEHVWPFACAKEGRWRSQIGGRPCLTRARRRWLGSGAQSSTPGPISTNHFGDG